MPEDNLQTPPSAFPPPNAQPVETPELPKKSSWKRWLAIILTLVILGGGGWALYRATRPKPVTPVVTKNEIPLIRYGTADGSVNNFYPKAEINVDFEINQQVFEGLVQYENQTRIKPLLAQSWSNPDEQTWLFKLEQGVKFHSGRTMSAQDVKYSLESFKDTLVGQVFGSTIKRVDVVDDYTVKVTTDGPDPILLNKLVFLYIVDSKSKLKNSAEAGTGPYTQKPGTKVTEKLNQLVAFDEYHGGRPLTRELSFEAFKDEASLTKAMHEDKIDIAADVFDQKNVDALSEHAASVPVNSIGVYYLGINHNKAGSPLQKLKVRQAIYEATDIPALLKARNLSGTPASQIVTQDIPGFNPEVTRPERDLAHAKHLLKQAGYPNGTTVTLTYFSGAQDAATEIARQLKQIGITVKLDGSDDVAYLSKKMDEGGGEMFFANYTSDVLDAIDVFTANFQGANYHSHSVDKLIAQANKTLDSAQRLQILQSISKKLMDELAWIPLYSGTSYWMVDPSYVVVKEMPGTNLGAFFWKVYAK